MISGAASDRVGVRTEYACLAQSYPGAVRKSQAVAPHEGKWYDILLIRKADGTEASVYLDISSFFSLKGAGG